ncbi:MAG: hypothetical protein JJ992_13835, partial [Planctomycetes bacterium]|nr:hypothetical protein [Planctomycetota bacterium]
SSATIELKNVLQKNPDNSFQLDNNGHKIPVLIPAPVSQLDANGNPLLEPVLDGSGQPLIDDAGNAVYKPVMLVGTIDLDSNQQPILVGLTNSNGAVLDANGNQLYRPQFTPDPDGKLITILTQETVDVTVPDGGNDGVGDAVILHGGQVNIYGDHTAAGDTFNLSTGDGSVVIEQEGVMTVELLNAQRGSGDPVFTGSTPAFSGDNLTIYGYAGDDQILAGNVDDNLIALRLVAGDDNDRIVGSVFSDVLDGGLGDDIFTGNAGVDFFFDDGGDDTLQETFDQDMSLFGDTFVVGTILGDSGGVFQKFSKTAEQTANEVAETRQAFITLRDTAENPAAPSVSLSAPSSANSQSTVTTTGDQVEIALDGDVLAGQTWNLTVAGQTFSYNTDNGVLKMVAVAKGLADQINAALKDHADARNTRYAAENNGPEPIVFGIHDTGDRYRADAEVESLVDGPSSTEIFENAVITGGTSNNTLVVGDSDNQILVGSTTRAVSDWTGSVVLDNRASSGGDNEYYLITLKGSGARYFIQDNGGTGAYDELYVFGTSGADDFSLNAAGGGTGIVTSGALFDGNAVDGDGAFPFKVSTHSSDILSNRNNVSTEITIAATASLQNRIRVVQDLVLQNVTYAQDGPTYTATFTVPADHPADGTVDALSTWSVELDGHVYSYTTMAGDTDASVASQFADLIRGTNPSREDVKFNGVERLTLRTLGGRDVITSYDTAVQTIVETGAGDDLITVGYVPTIPDRGNADFNNPS